MSGTLSQLATALADRYRIERAATDVAARHIVASATVVGRLICLKVRGRGIVFNLESLRDGVPSSDVSRGKPR